MVMRMTPGANMATVYVCFTTNQAESEIACACCVCVCGGQKLGAVIIDHQTAT